jgi:hypothetical protein
MNEKLAHVGCTRHHADANALGAFETVAFDLVSAHYASTPRSPRVSNLLNAVAPGGTLLIVGHDPLAMRVPINANEHSRPFDPDAYLRVDDFVTTLTNTPGWTIEIHENRNRAPGGRPPIWLTRSLSR